jgi:hypothetical protein
MPPLCVNMSFLYQNLLLRSMSHSCINLSFSYQCLLPVLMSPSCINRSFPYQNVLLISMPPLCVNMSFLYQNLLLRSMYHSCIDLSFSYQCLLLAPISPSCIKIFFSSPCLLFVSICPSCIKISFSHQCLLPVSISPSPIKIAFSYQCLLLLSMSRSRISVSFSWQCLLLVSMSSSRITVSFYTRIGKEMRLGIKGFLHHPIEFGYIVLSCLRIFDGISKPWCKSAKVEFPCNARFERVNTWQRILIFNSDSKSHVDHQIYNWLFFCPKEVFMLNDILSGKCDGNLRECPNASINAFAGLWMIWMVFHIYVKCKYLVNHSRWRVLIDDPNRKESCIVSFFHNTNQFSILISSTILHSIGSQDQIIFLWGVEFMIDWSIVLNVIWEWLRSLNNFCNPGRLLINSTIPTPEMMLNLLKLIKSLNKHENHFN